MIYTVPSEFSSKLHLYFLELSPARPPTARNYYEHVALPRRQVDPATAPWTCSDSSLYWLPHLSCDLTCRGCTTPQSRAQACLRWYLMCDKIKTRGHKLARV
jgi:hypothetical protein